MATPGIRHRRIALLSAQPLSRLPRIDLAHVRRELSSVDRRQGTAGIRREYQESRRYEYEAKSFRKAEIERLKKYKAYLDKVKVLYGNTCTQGNASPKKIYEESPWQREIIKTDLPERLPISLPIRLGSARLIDPPVERLSNTSTMFYRVNHADGTKNNDMELDASQSQLKRKLQYIISNDWNSERLSWKTYHTQAPEYQKANWIC